jgi:hypothetical protein
MATWTIGTLERDLQGDLAGGVIVETVGEETYSASSYGTCGFTPDPSSEGYIAYDDLTEADVIGWCQGELDVEAIESGLTASIEEQKNPTTADGVPW